MRMNKLLMMLALGACCLSGAAETIAYWRYGKVSSVRVTTGVVAPADFLTERLKAGLTVLLH